MESEDLTRSIGVSAAVMTMIGYIVGGSIFILPGALAADVGPGVIVAYMLACLPAVLLAFVAVQVAGIFPVSGAGCVAASRVLSPFWGFMSVWIMLIIMLFAVPPLALGFADYVTVFVPGLGPWRMFVAFVCIAGFAIVNLLGVHASVRAQQALVVVFMGALALFGITGTFLSKSENLLPIFPEGLGPVLSAAIPAYYSYSGFMMITSIAGEVKEPRKTIPWAMAIGFGIVLVTYTLISIAVPGVVPWRELAGVEAPVAYATGVVFGPWMASVIGVAALFAIATSVNGILLGASRDLYGLARKGVFPSWFGRVHARRKIPDVAVLTIAGVASLGLLFRGSFAEYASLAVVCVMVMHIIVAVVILRLETVMPEEFSASPIRLPRGLRYGIGYGTIVISLFFIARALRDSPISVMGCLVAIAAGVVLFALRRQSLLKRGLHLEELVGRTLSIDPVPEPLAAEPAQSTAR